MWGFNWNMTFDIRVIINCTYTHTSSSLLNLRWETTFTKEDNGHVPSYMNILLILCAKMCAFSYHPQQQHDAMNYRLVNALPIYSNLSTSAPSKDFKAGPILQICIQVMMALHQIHQFLAWKWLNEQEKPLSVLICKILLSQFANTLGQNRDIRA